MAAVVSVRWKGPGVLMAGGRVIASPGERVQLTATEADVHVRAGKAEYPRN